MQSIWSRIAAVGSCRCPQCLSQATGGVSRRAASYATRRAPKYLTSSTFWLSGIFAAATTLDASVKTQRREKWDHAIGRLKHELGHDETADVVLEQRQAENVAAQTLDQDARVSIPAASEGHPLQSNNEDEWLETLRTVGGSVDVRTSIGSGKQIDLATGASAEDSLDVVEPMPRRPSWPTNSGGNLHIVNLPPQSIYAPKEFKGKWYSKPWHPKKLARSNCSVDWLQWQIISILNARGWSDEAAASVPQEYRKYILADEGELRKARCDRGDELSTIRSWPYDGFELFAPAWSRFRICQQEQDRDGHFLNELNDLNLTLQNLFRQKQSDAISHAELLGLICTHLGCCKAPPNVETYNTLLIGLSGLKDYEVNDRVIRTVRKVYIRPNEVTLTEMLRHYIDTDDLPKFAQLVGRMRGRDRGLMFARNDIRINKKSNGRLVRTDLVWPNEPAPATIQLPHATPMVFAVLISGVLKFLGFEEAMKMCIEMARHGWGLCMRGLTPLLKDCVEYGDWENGSMLWREIRRLEKRSELKASWRMWRSEMWRSERISLENFVAMLQLCSVSGRKESYAQTLDLAGRSGYGEEEIIAAAKSQVSKSPEKVCTVYPVKRSKPFRKDHLASLVPSDMLSTSD